MGMQQKLNKAYQEGFEVGQKEANQHARLFGQIEGANETWQLMEDMFTQIDGIGPKTKEKILLKIKEYANREKRRLEGANEPKL